MKKLIPILSIILAIAAASCNSRSAQSAPPEHQEVNSVYYWKTVLQLDSAELAFMANHDVRRIYLRMFDVTADDGEWKAIPNATIRIPASAQKILNSGLDTMEIVPVVYITLDALRQMADDEGELARNITERVANMCQFHKLPNVSELQLDCDWTPSTEKLFFTLCDSIRSSFSELNLPWRLSSTVRLHQLAKKAPPVDAGVLMVYNTGSFDSPETKNSIIDREDIMPYLKKLPDYPLHLDIAYPTYSWQLVFSAGKFAGIAADLDLDDRSLFEPRGENIFIARTDVPHNRTIIHRGDIIRREISDFNEIEAVKREIEQRLSSRKHSNIIYHLDPKNLKNYSSDEIKSIFAPGR